jgi:uncharacterized repeat protein (TIGR03803 family)
MGGAYGNGVVFKLDSSGNETVLHAFGALPDAQNPFFGGLIKDKEGNLYGTTCCGGTGGRGDGTVFEITNAGEEKILYNFQGAPGDGDGPNGGLTRDSAGNFYGVTYLGGQYSWGTVWQLSASGAETVLYSFAGTPDGADPYAETLVRDSAGNLYGTNYYDAEYGWGSIFEISPTGKETILYDFPGAPGAYLAYSGLIEGKDGDFYGVTEGGGTANPPYGYGTIYKISRSGKFTLLYSFQGPPDDGREPFGELVRDKAGNLYGTTIQGGKSDDGTVFKLDTTGHETVLHSFSGSDGAEPFAPVILDSKGNLYGTARQGGADNYGVVFRLTPK